jgi:hypothetical protein
MAIQSTPAVLELAQVFHDRDQAVLLLQRAGFPMCMIPEFTTPLSFWIAVAEKARNGAILHGMQPVLDAAASLYPNNPLFGRRDDVRALGSWDHVTTRCLLSPPGVNPFRPAECSHEPKVADHCDERPRLCFSMSLGFVGAPFSKAFTVLACALTSTAIITSLAIGAQSQPPSAVQPAVGSARPAVMEQLESRVLPSEEEILLIEDDPAPEEHGSTARSKRGKKKGARKLGSKSPRGKPSTELEGEPWEYSIYNCIVGPDEPDEGEEPEPKEGKKLKPNPKGACYWDDQRAFLMTHPQPNAPPSD